MEKVLRTERGWGGHFICANRCAFRRNTLLECGDVRIVVSTVGAFKPRHDAEYERIGCDRFFETMAFHADYEEPYWDADVTREVSFDAPRSIADIKRESDAEADAMHEAVVAEISGRMAAGGILGD
jgi:hypothetical protein